MPYTNVSKPTGTGYTNANPVGREGFDVSTITFDQSTTFFDSINTAAWTNVASPFRPISLNIGMTMGLLIPLTSGVNIRGGDPWTRVVKPT